MVDRRGKERREERRGRSTHVHHHIDLSKATHLM